MKRITIVCGHYGSGKTEFCINYAMQRRALKQDIALVDIDIANVYFRSREQKNFLEEKGIMVYGSSFSHEITAELPAISASIKKPLEDSSCETIVDVGGDESGARILHQFSKYFTQESSRLLCVINGNRPETDTLEGAKYHIEKIHKETGLPIEGLINNTHLLTQTKMDDILFGIQLCDKISMETGIPVIYHCCIETLCEELEKRTDGLFPKEVIFPLKLYMRPSWLDR